MVWRENQIVITMDTEKGERQECIGEIDPHSKWLRKRERPNFLIFGNPWA